MAFLPFHLIKIEYEPDKTLKSFEYGPDLGMENGQEHLPYTLGTNDQRANPANN